MAKYVIGVLLFYQVSYVKALMVTGLPPVSLLHMVGCLCCLSPKGATVTLPTFVVLHGLLFLGQGFFEGWLPLGFLWLLLALLCFLILLFVTYSLILFWSELNIFIIFNRISANKIISQYFLHRTVILF